MNFLRLYYMTETVTEFKLSAYLSFHFKIKDFLIFFSLLGVRKYLHILFKIIYSSYTTGKTEFFSENNIYHFPNEQVIGSLMFISDYNSQMYDRLNTL